jgi:hypothetical protein
VPPLLSASVGVPPVVSTATASSNVTSIVMVSPVE